MVLCGVMACGGTAPTTSGDAGTPPHTHDGGDGGLAWGGGDAGPAIPQGTLLGLTASSGSSARVVRIELPSGNVTDLFGVTPPTGYRTVGLTKRPDGTLYVVEQEPQFSRTHLVRVDESTGTTIDERVFDGGGSPGDYAADGKMWLGSWDSISSHLSTLDASGPPASALDLSAIVNDVACIGPTVYVLASSLGGSEDPRLVVTLSAYENGALSPMTLLSPTPSALAPLGEDLILVVDGSNLVALDPTTGTPSAPVVTPYAFLDITED